METNLEPLIFKKKIKIKASKDQEKQLELEENRHLSTRRAL